MAALTPSREVHLWVYYMEFISRAQRRDRDTDSYLPIMFSNRGPTNNRYRSVSSLKDNIFREISSSKKLSNLFIM